MEELIDNERTKRYQNRRNLKIAFSGESQARVKYGYYAKQAKKEAMNKSQPSLKRHPITKKNTPNCGLRLCTADRFRRRLKTC
jgi:hypothetical protein